MKVLLAIWLIILTLLFVWQTVRMENAVNELFQASYNITHFMNELADVTIALSDEVENDRNRIMELENEVSQQEKNISKLASSIEELKSSVEVLRRQKGLVNPSYYELVKFVAEDLTDSLLYTEYFTCVDFSNTFVKNFRERGYYSCVAYVEFEEGAHDLVAVNTTDLGLLYVEPQSDVIILSLKVGDNYCAKVGWDCDYYIKKLSSCFQ